MISARGGPIIPDVHEMDIRSCAAYIAKLKSILDSSTGDPPQGITVGEVEHRIMLLQGALDEVKNRSLELTKQKELEEQQRYLKSVQRLLKQEEELQAKQAKDTKEKILAVQQAKEDAVLYFRDKNEKTEERTQRCKEYRDKADAEISVRAASNDVRRQKNLEQLYAERERKRLEARERSIARQQYARNVMKNREQQNEMKRVQLEEKAKLHEQEIEAKLEMIRNSRKSKWTNKGQRSRARSIVVWENGEAILETEQKDHDQLVKELNEKIKAQQERYAGEKADRDFYIQQQQQLRRERLAKVNGNLLKLANGRLTRGEGIIEDHHKKREKADNAMQHLIEQRHEAGERLRKQVNQELLCAAEIENKRRDQILNNAFEGWNHRAARVVADLRRDMEEDKTNEPEDDDPWQNNTGRAPQPKPEKRPVRLPYPSDFSIPQKTEE